MTSEEWEKTSLESLLEILPGYAFKSELFSDGSTEGPGLIRIRDLESHKPSVCFKGNYDQKWVIKPGELLVGMDGDFTVARWRGPEALLNQRVCRIRSTDCEHLDEIFLYYAIGPQIRKIHRTISRTTVKHLSTRHLRKIVVDLPPLPEQRKIATILSSVDETIEKTEAVIEQLQVVKKAMMRELLTRGLPGRHTEFRSTEEGIYPADWQVVPLANLIQAGPDNGLYRPKSDYGSGIPIVRIDSFAKGDMVTSAGHPRVRILPEMSTRFLLQAGDILINRVNSLSHLGKSAFVLSLSEPTVFESNMMRIRVSEALVSPAFAFLSTCSPSAQAYFQRRAKQAVAQASINQDDVRQFLVPLPPLSEQFQIVELISSVQRRIAEELRVSERLHGVKSALLQALLTGQTRVTPDEPSS